MSVTEVKTVTDLTVKKEASKKINHKIERDKDAEKVRGKFIFHEVAGGLMSFVFKGHKGDEVERFDLFDGEVYTIPLGVAKHLNKNLWYPQHAYTMDENNKPIMKISQKVRRCSFQSLEFIDTADLTPVGKSLFEVERLIQ